MLYPKKELLIEVHNNIIESQGGEPGISNESNLENAIDRPATITYGVTQFEGVVRKAAALSYSIIVWHPFIDGNKRTAVNIMRLMLVANGTYLAIPPYMVKYTVKAAFLPEDPRSMSEDQFVDSIHRLCTSSKFVAIFKRFRFETLPYLRLNFALWFATFEIRAFEDVLVKHPLRYPKFIRNLYGKLASRKSLSKLILGTPMDWWAAGDEDIFEQSIKELERWEKEGFPKSIPPIKVEESDFTELE